MPTKVLAEFGGDLVRFECDYDASQRLTAIRCVNGSDYAVTGTVTRLDNGRAASRVFDPHTTQERAIPTGIAGRIVFDGIGHRGQLVGLAFELAG